MDDGLVSHQLFRSLPHATTFSLPTPCALFSQVMAAFGQFALNVTGTALDATNKLINGEEGTDVGVLLEAGKDLVDHTTELLDSVATKPKAKGSSSAASGALKAAKKTSAPGESSGKG